MADIRKRPEWCKHKDCITKRCLQEKMCVGELPEPVKHHNDFNTHRLCIDTRETGHGIFDLRINKSDAYGIKLLTDIVKNSK